MIRLNTANLQTFAVAAGLGTTFTWDGAVVAEVLSTDGIELTVAEIDSTNINPTDGYETSVPGVKTAGDVVITGQFEATDTTGQIAMVTDFEAKSSKTGIITFPTATGATWTFSGYIKAIKFSSPDKDNIITFDATIKVVGKPTFAVATSAGMSAVTISDSAVVTPTFAIGTFDYVATVADTVDSVTVTPTAAAGVITVNGNTVVTTETSSAITLGAAGTNTTITVIVTETNKAPKTYVFRVARAA